MATRSFFANINLDQNELQFAVLHSLSSAPSSGSEVSGQIYYDTSANQPFFYNGSSWLSMSSSTASSVPFSGVLSGTNTNQVLVLGNSSEFLITDGALQFKGSSSGIMTLGTNLTGATDRFINLPDITGSSIILATTESPSSGEFAKQSAGADGTITFASISNSDITDILALDDLTDVVITTPDNPSYLRYNGSNWIDVDVPTLASDVGSAIDHGSILGLGDDDHTQYIINSPTANTRNQITGDTGQRILIDAINGTGGTYGVTEGNTFFRIRTNATDDYLRFNATSNITMMMQLSAVNFQLHNNTPIVFKAGSTAAANGVSLKANETISSSYTILLPGSGPAASGNILYNTGSGTMAWGGHDNLSGLASGDSHTQYVYISPNSSARNLIAAANSTTIPLTIRGNASQSVDVFVVENSGGTNYLTIDSSGDATFSQDVIITGDLTVNGTTTTVNTTNLVVEDNIIVVNSAGTVQNAGLEVERGANPNASILYNETSDEWFINNASVSLQVARKFVDDSTITGDGLTDTFDIVHNMGTLNVIVAVYDSSDNQIEVEIVITDSNTVTTNFSNPVPVSITYRVVVVG